jgi:hypothetical protein
MALISDVLRGPYGDPQPGVIITMKAKGTSSKVLVANNSAIATDSDGKYSMQVFPGRYEVVVSTLGKIGEIQVFSDSKDGTLNDFLLAPGEDELTPAVVQTVDTMRADAAKSAATAKVSEGNSKRSETNAANSAAQVATAFDNIRFKFPENNTNIATWFLLGRFKNAGQNGVGIAINFYGSNGFNGFTYNSGLSRLMLRTGNLSAADTTNKVNRIGGIFSNDAGTMISDIQIIESSRDNYEVYVNVNAFTINCWYTVEQITYANAAGLRWEHKAEKQTTAPVGVMKIDMRTSLGSAREATVNDISNLKDWGLSKGVTAAIKGNFNAQMQSRRGYVATDAIGNPFKDTGTHFLDTRSWAVTQTGTDDSYRTVQTCYGYGTSAASVGKIAVRSWNGTIFTPWIWLWSEANTTVDSNGFIKKASPIVKLFRDGTCELNGESQGVTTERLSDGVYRVSGTLGFNADAQWGGPDGGIEVPLDRNKQPLIWVDYEVEPTGDLLIKTYHRTHPAAPAFARNEVLGYDEGMPIDIPDGRWIDLRVEMPEEEAPAQDMELVETKPETSSGRNPGK